MKLNGLTIFIIIPLFFILFHLPCFGAVDNSPPSSVVKLIFIHHSTGGNWLADSNTEQPYGALGTALMNNNYYVSATNYGWGPESIGDLTDIPDWPSWFTGTNSSTVLSSLYTEYNQNVGDFGSWARLAVDPGGQNEIIMFKSCFPNSDLFGNTTDAAGTTPNDQFTVSNAKAVYNNLLTYFQTRTDKLFIVITAPPQNENEYSADSQTPAERSANARAFNNWLVNDWLDGYAYTNVAVFDYFNVLTGTDNHHRWYNNAVEHVTNTNYNYSAYPSDEWDSHPSTTGHQKATTEFVDLLNYYYNRWKASSNSSCLDLLEVTGVSVAGTNIANSSMTIAATASNDCGGTVYYRFGVVEDYGTGAYDPSNWRAISEYTTSNSLSYTFTEAGSYIFTVTANDTPSEPAEPKPMLGGCITIQPSGGTDCLDLLKVTNVSITGTNTVNSPMTITATASNECGGTVYYRFGVVENYGTGSYDPSNWQSISEYTTSNSLSYTFTEAGSYIFTVTANHTPSEPAEPKPMLGGCITITDGSTSTTDPDFSLSSQNFSDGGIIPLVHACSSEGGSNRSPQLSWTNPPQSATSYALIMDDEDSPCGTGDNACRHWAVFNIPSSVTSFQANQDLTSIDGVTQGENYEGTIGYAGPCPPNQHSYNFTIYALSSGMPTIGSGVQMTRSQFESAYASYVLDSATLIGVFAP